MDVTMPGIDGFETYRRLKANPEMADVPVLFLTVLSDMHDKTKGFEAGGVDYITKPIDKTEVLLRIRTHLELGRLRRELALHNAELEKRVTARTAELREEVVRRTRSEQLQRLTRQLVEEQAAQRRSLTSALSRQVREHLTPINESIRQLLEQMRNPGDREHLHAIASQIQTLPRVLQRVGEGGDATALQSEPLHANPLLVLSEREREVLMLTVNSYSTGDIADLLHVTSSTVRTYRHRILQKLEVKDTTELVRLAVRHGLTDYE